MISQRKTLKILETPESKVDPTDICPQYIDCWYSNFESLKMPNIFPFSKRKQVFCFNGRLSEEKQLSSWIFTSSFYEFFMIKTFDVLEDVLVDFLIKVVFVFDPLKWVFIKKTYFSKE